MRNALLTAIYAHMQANPDDPFVAAIGENYAPWEGMQNGPYPSAVSYIVSEIDLAVMGEQRSEFEWQMSIYGPDLTQLNDLGQSCRNLFDSAKLCGSARPFSCFYEATFGPMRSDDSEPYQVTVTFFSKT